MTDINKFNSIDNFIDTAKYNGEKISKLLGCAETFGSGKEKVFQDDKEWNENSDQDIKAKTH
ncbi:MAG TPA: hypothetical protein ACHBX0_15285 [Arsenophonus sp.]